LWGLVSAVTLFAILVDAWPPLPLFRDTPKWEVLKDVNSALLIIGLVYVAVCTAFFHRWLHATVPLAARRQATLERRSAGNYVPRSIRYTVYAAVALHLGAWLAVGAFGRYATAAFWGTLAFQFVISGIMFLVAMNTIRRRPTAMDRILGDAYRRTEVRVAFAIQLVPLMNGIARLYEQTGNVSPGDVDRALHLALVALVVVLATASVARWRPTRHAPGGPSTSVTSAWGLIATLFITTTPHSSPAAPSDDESISPNPNRTQASAQLTGQPAVEIFTSASWPFFNGGVEAPLTFEIDAAMRRQNELERRARRLDRRPVAPWRG
jgi:hypothetical protein